jgi:hypothetical protein
VPWTKLRRSSRHFSGSRWVTAPALWPAVLLIEHKHPNSLAIYLVDLDAEEHETEPFSNGIERPTN